MLIKYTEILTLLKTSETMSNLAGNHETTWKDAIS